MLGASLFRDAKHRFGRNDLEPFQQSFLGFNGTGKTNQHCSIEFLFHLINSIANIEFAQKSFFFLTSSAHRNFALWKSCGLNLKLRI
jgi:hypothetical protein